jgi:hypothetical protein
LRSSFVEQKEGFSIAPKINKFGLGCGLKNKFEVMVEFSKKPLSDSPACARKLSGATYFTPACYLPLIG